ncbi:MAG TPA: C40 family peptidase [Gaiellaceae bacterium]|nr:C40 family peptidase [Gaiellaceae bacterium]
MTTPLRLALLAVAICASLVLAAGRAAASTAHHARASHATLGIRAVQFARHLLGTRYVYGGSTPRTGFDCSGLVRYVYAHFGISLPHSSYADFDLGRRVSRRGLRPGDLVFFHGLGHVGIYVGAGKFIHAPHTGTRVSYSTLAEYGSEYDGARRLVR